MPVVRNEPISQLSTQCRYICSQNDFSHDSAINLILYPLATYAIYVKILFAQKPPVLSGEFHPGNAYYTRTCLRKCRSQRVVGSASWFLGRTFTGTPNPWLKMRGQFVCNLP